MAKKKPYFNPSTGISSFVGEDEEEFKGKYIEPVVVAGKPFTWKVVEKKPFTKKEERALKGKVKEQEVKETKPVKKQSFLVKAGYVRRAKPMRERLKVLRFSNILERKRLQNEIQRLKLMKKIELMKRTGKLKQIITAPVLRPRRLLYPAYATPEIMGDIDSAFFGDIGHADGNIFGGESYYDEDFYNEDYYGREWDTDPFFHLQIKPNRNVSPLLW